MESWLVAVGLEWGMLGAESPLTGQLIIMRMMGSQASLGGC